MTDAEAEALILWPLMWGTDSWKRCWERLKAVGEGDNRGWDGWMELPTWWTWVCTSSGSWWWIGKPIPSPNLSRETWRASVHGVRFGQDWVTEPNWLCLYSRNGTANPGFVLHICLQHGLLNILSRLLLPTTQEEKKKFKILLLRQCTWPPKSCDRDIQWC